MKNLTKNNNEEFNQIWFELVNRLYALYANYSFFQEVVIAI